MTEQERYELRNAADMVRREALAVRSAGTTAERNAARRRLAIARGDLQIIVRRNGGLLMNERNVYRTANLSRVISMALIPVGVLMAAGAILTGATGDVANLLTGGGLVAAGAGYVYQRFICSQERQQEIERRAQDRERELALAEDVLNSTASL